MPQIIRIRDLVNEPNLSGVTFPIDKSEYFENARQVGIFDLKEFVLSGFTGNVLTGMTSGTSGVDGFDGDPGTSGTSGINGSAGSAGTSGTSGISMTGLTADVSVLNISGGTRILHFIKGAYSGYTDLALPITTTTTTFTPTTTTTTFTPITTTTTTISGLPCGTPVSYASGQAYPSSGLSYLGTSYGTVNLTFDALNIPDQFIVIYDNNIVINTGYRGSSSYDFGGGSRNSFKTALSGKTDPVNGGVYPNFTNYVDDGYPRVITAPSGSAGSGVQSFYKSLTQTAIVKVYAPMPSTQWNYTLGCPY